MIQRIFRRKIYDKILKWKEENQGKTALLIEGARRVGKSTVVERGSYGKTNFKGIAGDKRIAPHYCE